MLLNTAVPPGKSLPDFRLDPPYIKQLLLDMASPLPYTVGPPKIGKGHQGLALFCSPRGEGARWQAQTACAGCLPLEKKARSYQGYWISRPIEAAAMTHLLSKGARLVAASKTLQKGAATWIQAHGKASK